MSNLQPDVQAVSGDRPFGAEPSRFTAPAEQIVADRPVPDGNIDWAAARSGARSPNGGDHRTREGVFKKNAGDCAGARGPLPRRPASTSSPKYSPTQHRTHSPSCRNSPRAGR